MKATDKVYEMVKRTRKREANIRAWAKRKTQKEYAAWDVYVFLMGIVIGLLMFWLIAAWNGVL